MIEQRTHMSQIPALAGVAAARAARIRTAPRTGGFAFCISVLTTTDAGDVPNPHRRPPIE